MDETVYDTTWSLLESNPNLQKDIEAVLQVDEELDRWDFDDIDLDSGTFGKLVDRQIIKRDNNQYTVSDHTAVKEALSDFQDGTKQNNGSTAGITSPDGKQKKLRGILERAKTGQSAVTETGGSYARYLNWNVIGLITALLAVVGMRSRNWSDVFRETGLVSPANDPYYYRYVQAQMLEHADGVTDISALTEIGEEGTRPLTHILNWWIPELFGESQTVADWVAIVLPVTLAVLAGAVVYMIAVKVTADARVGVLAVLFYAVAPVHLVYTSLGFLEHRAHQYLWLAIMAFTLVWLAVDLRQRLEQMSTVEAAVSDHLQSQRTWAITGVFTLAVALTPHFWGGSPLHFIPVAGYIALRVLMDARNNVSPVWSLMPVLVGLGIGGLLGYIPHAVWGWRPAFAVLTPLLVFAGGIAVALYAEIGMQRDVSATALLAGEGIIGIGGLAAFRTMLPAEFAAAQARANDLFFRDSAIETESLFATLQRPVIQIGPSLYLGLIGLIIGILVVRRGYRPSWLVVIVFSTVYLILAAFQIRFAAHLVLFITIFGAITTIYLLSKINLVRPIRAIEELTSETSTPQISGLIQNIRSISLPKSLFTGIIIGIVVLALVSVVFVGLGPIIDDITHDQRYDAAVEFNEHAEEIDREYPENFVLSQWGDNRMYNYFVNGEARSYGYAQSTHQEFVSDSDPDDWFDEFDGRVGYVAIAPLESPEGTVHHQLWYDAGFRNSSVSHYQFLGDMDGYRMFAVVEGATITTGNDTDEIFVQRQEDIIEGYEYKIKETGGATVAYEGNYTVVTESGATVVSVNESQVYEGSEIEVSLE